VTTKKKLEKKVIQKVLTAKFEEYRVFQNPYIFCTDFLHQQLVLPFPWLPPHIIGGPLEFLEADTGHVASWSEADSQGGSSPHRKEEIVREPLKGDYSSS